jgi:hypothetical protein
MRKIAILLIAVMILGLAGCGADESEIVTRDNIGFNSVYYSELGFAVSFGMTKAEVDELLGEPVEASRNIGGYSYRNDSIIISYESGIVNSIFTNTRRWLFKDQIRVGNSRADVISKFGDEYIDGRELTGADIFMFFTNNTDIVKEDEAMFSVNVFFDSNGNVEALLINKREPQSIPD